MGKRVLDVGNCGPDFRSIQNMLLKQFPGVEVLQAHGLPDTLATLRETQVDLVLINRKLDQDYSDGIEILKELKQDPDLQSVPVMLITNYEEHQTAAMELGAERGFGKLELQTAETQERLSAVLSA